MAADDDRGGALVMRFGDMLSTHPVIREYLAEAEIDGFAQALADAAVDQWGSSS